MCRPLGILCFALLALASGPDFAVARSIRDLNTQEKIDSSDIVVIGKVLRVGIVGRFEYERFAEMEIISSSSQKARRTKILLKYKGAIAEEDLDCCVIGGRYLIFVVRRSDGPGYESVNGRNGVYRLDHRLPRRLDLGELQRDSMQFLTQW